MVEKIFNLIKTSNTICLMTHESPDGDAIGSVLAFYNYLSSINKSVDIVVRDKPLVYSFLKNYEKIGEESNKNYDLGIVVDCSSKERIGCDVSVFDNCNSTINIDHHITNTSFSDINYIVEGSPSCTQIIYYLFKHWNITVNEDIASPLMTGLLTDTCGFRNNNVNKDAYLMTADLFNVVDIYSIYDKSLFKKTRSQFELSQIATKRLELLDNNRIAFTYILKDDFDKTGAVVGEHEGIVDIGRSIDGVEVSAFIREDQDGFKISLRSTGRIKVNKIAEKFNGGGHDMAAGCTISKNFKETKDLLVMEIIKELNV